jgi:hypothetical protein
MVVHEITRWSFSTIMLFAVSAAVAQTGHTAPGADGDGKFRAACGEDVHRFCVGVQPGGLVQCLWPHTDELSAACRDMIAPSAESPATQSAAPAQGNAAHKKPPSPVQTRDNPARENAPSKKPPSPPPSAPAPAQESAPNKEPPSTLIPD